MPGYLGKTTNNPRDVTGQQAQAERDSMWGPIPGVTVGAWNGRTVNVQPKYRPMHNGVPVDMPLLYDVPVDQPMTANGGMTFPIPEGTPVMLTPQMRAMEGFEEGGDATATDARSFHISTARASLSGGDSLSTTIENIDLENFHLRFNASGTFGLKGSPDGKFQLAGAQGDVIDLLAEVVETLAVLTTTVSGGSSSGIWPITQQAALAVLAGRLRAMVL
jgi:hypothetical protein